LSSMNIYLNSGNNKNFALGNLMVRYPLDSEGGIKELEKDARLSLLVGAETLTVNYEAVSDGNATVRIYSSSGVNVVNRTMPLMQGSNSYTINTKFLTSGLYVVMFENNGITSCEKFIIR